MSLILKDRCKQRVAVNAGTNSITLTTAVTGFRTISSVLSNGDSSYFCLESGSSWEVFIGTYTSSTTTISRDTVLASSNGGSKINLGTSITFCYIAYPADKAVYRNTANEVVVPSEGFRFSDNTTQITSPTAAIALKADIASPTFTGVPAAPTASGGTNTTQIATTAFVSSAIAAVDLSVYTLLPDILPVAGTLLSYGGSRQLAAGGTVTHSGALTLGGALTLPGNPSSALHAAPKQYVDSAVGAIDLSGLVPYTGATGAVNLGSNRLTADGVVVSGGLVGCFSAGTWNGWTIYRNQLTGTSSGRISWTNTSDALAGTEDLKLVRAAAATLAQCNGINAQCSIINKSYTGDSIQEALMLDAGKQVAGNLGLYSYRGTSGGSNYPIQIGMLAADGTTFSGFTVGTDGSLTFKTTGLGALTGSLNWEAYNGQARLATNNFSRFGIMSVGYNAGGQSAFMGGIGGWANNLVLGLGYAIQMSSLNYGEPYTLQAAADCQLLRSSTGPAWIVAANGGIQVRNFANSADAPISCGAITASGNIATTGNVNATSYVISNAYYSTNFDNFWTKGGTGASSTFDICTQTTARIRNYTNSTDAGLSCAAITASGRGIFGGATPVVGIDSAAFPLISNFGVMANAYSRYTAYMYIEGTGGALVGAYDYTGGNYLPISLVGSVVGSYADSGFKVRNRADSSDAALTCGAITASSTVSCPQINGIGTGYSVGVFGPSADLSSGYRNLDINAPTGLPVLQFKTNGTLRAQHYWESNVFNIYSAGNHALTSSSATQMLGFGGLMVGTPALKRVLNTLQVRLGDDSNFADLATGAITASSLIRCPRIQFDYNAEELSSVSNGFVFQSATQLYFYQNSVLALKIFNGMLRLNAGVCYIGGSGIETTITGSNTNFKIQSNSISLRNAADSGDAPLSCGAITASGAIVSNCSANTDWFSGQYASSEYVKIGYNAAVGYGLIAGAAYGGTASGVSFGTNALNLRSISKVNIGTSSATFSEFDNGSNTSPYICIHAVGLTTKPGLQIDQSVGTTSIPLNVTLNGSSVFSVSSAGDITASGNLTLSDTNLITGTTTGTIIATANSHKLGFWGATPVVQPTTAVAAATLVSNLGTPLTDTDSFDGYTLKQIVKALRIAGLLA